MEMMGNSCRFSIHFPSIFHPFSGKTFVSYAISKGKQTLLLETPQMGMISKFASANDSIIPRFLKLTVVEKKDENKRLALFSKERSELCW